MTWNPHKPLESEVVVAIYIGRREARPRRELAEGTGAGKGAAAYHQPPETVQMAAIALLNALSRTCPQNHGFRPSPVRRRSVAGPAPVRRRSVAGQSDGLTKEL